MKKGQMVIKEECLKPSEDDRSERQIRVDNTSFMEGVGDDLESYPLIVNKEVAHFFMTEYKDGVMGMEDAFMLFLVYGMCYTCGVKPTHKVIDEFLGFSKEYVEELDDFLAEAKLITKD